MINGFFSGLASQTSFRLRLRSACIGGENDDEASSSRDAAAAATADLEKRKVGAIKLLHQRCALRRVAVAEVHGCQHFSGNLQAADGCYRLWRSKN